jgi:methionine sulfoxide reductase heme-binding subunit
MNAYTDPGQHIFWIASRSLGVVALMLAALSVGLGLAMSGRLVKGAEPRGRLKQLHEATALASLIAIAGHGLALLGDSYLHPGLSGISIPFAVSYRSFWTGLGILGGYLAAILGLTYYVRGWIGPKLWRRLHRWTLVVYLLGAVHTIGAGTDAGTPWLIAILVATAAPIALLAAIRWLPPSASPPTRRRRHRIPLPSEQF